MRAEAGAVLRMVTQISESHGGNEGGGYGSPRAEREDDAPLPAASARRLPRAAALSATSPEHPGRMHNLS